MTRGAESKAGAPAREEPLWLERQNRQRGGVGVRGQDGRGEGLGKGEPNPVLGEQSRLPALAPTCKHSPPPHPRRRSCSRPSSPSDRASGGTRLGSTAAFPEVRKHALGTLGQAWRTRQSERKDARPSPTQKMEQMRAHHSPLFPLLITVSCSGMESCKVIVRPCVCNF